jgi:hypothetical protein
MIRSTRAQILIFLGSLFFVPAVNGETNGGIEYSGSGFLTVAAGKMLGGSHNNVQDYNCPCFISDYAQAAVYDGRSGLQWRPDSKLGVQGSATYNSISVTAQVVARGVDSSANLEWLYGSYNLNNKITIQAGRKRLPMFYFSDVQDVGIALPWTHLPPGPYGWEAVNYNGISVRYQDRISEWSTSANLLAGYEANNDSGYWKIYNGRQSKSSIKWSNIIGGELTLTKDWLETRAVYIQSNTQENYSTTLWDTDPASPTFQTYIPQSGPIYPNAKQRILGLAANIDYQNWLVRSEVIQIDHPGLTYQDHAQLLGIGYHYGKWQPMVTWSQYRGSVVTNGNIEASSYPNRQETLTLTLRYDLTTNSDVKIQFDSQSDHSDPLYSPNYGNARLLTLSYDSVF